MITYCIGSARQKRAYFRERDAVVLDNTEVLFCASENGRNYFAIGGMPFGSFTVEQYVKYHTALKRDKPDLAQLKRLGIPPHKRVSRLLPVELRIVDLFVKVCGKTDKAVVVNLDGTKYTRRGNRALFALVDILRDTDVYVLVSDMRYLKKAASGVKVLQFGKRVNKRRPSFYAARILAARIGAKKVAVF